MAAGRYDVVAEQGAAFTRSIVYEDSEGALVNLTGYTARMHVRRAEYSATPILEATSTDGSIALGGAAGTIAITIPATTMANAPAGSWYYDLELLPEGDEDRVIRLLEGRFTVTREITR